MTGIILAGFGAGNFIGPPVSNWLISSYGWRTSYFILGIVTMVLLMLVAQLLRRDPGEAGRLPYGQSTKTLEGLAPEVREFSSSETIRTRQFWMLCLINVCFGIGQMAIAVHLAPYATDLGISTYTAASILAVMGVLNIAGRIGFGSAVDRIGNKPALTIGLIMVSVSLFWLLLAKESWMLFLFAIIFGLGTGGVPAMMSALVAELFGMKAHGEVLGITAFAWGIGSAVGPIMAGYIFDMTEKYQLAFIIFAILGAITLALSLLLKSTARESLVSKPGK